MQQPINEQQRYTSTLFQVFSLAKSAQSTQLAPQSIKVKAIRIIKADGTHNLRLHVENNGTLEPPLEFPMDKRRLRIPEIVNYSYPFNPIDIHEIIVNLMDNMLSIPTINEFNSIGWHYDKNGNVDYWKSAIGIDLQGKPLVKDIYAPYPSYAGNLQENIKYINDYITTPKRGEVAQAIILYGFSAVLAGYLHKNLLLSLSGGSSRGKTIISKLIISLFAEPENEKLSTTFNVTVNKMAERLNGINGAATLIDDLSLAPSNVKKDIDGMVYVLESGKEKERMRTKSFDRDPATWNTTIIFSAEEPLLGLCNQEHEGGVGRLMELNIALNDLFFNADEANQISELSHKHYGLLADEFVKRLISNNILNSLTNLYEQEKKRVRGNYSGPLARMAENVAIITLCGTLLNQLFPFQFKTNDIEKYLMSTAKENLESFRISQKGNVIKNIIYPYLIAKARQLCPNENGNFTDHVVISSKITNMLLAEIQEKHGYKPIDVKRVLKDEGYLHTNDATFSYTGTINGKSFRGIYLYDKTKGDPAT